MYNNNYPMNQYGPNQGYYNNNRMMMNRGMYNDGPHGYNNYSMGPNSMPYGNNSYGYGGGDTYDPYNRLYNDPYTQNPNYPQYGNTTYQNNDMQYRSTYPRMMDSTYRSSTSTSSNQQEQQQQSLSTKQELRRIKYLLILLTSFGGILVIIWKRWLSKYWSSFIRRIFISNTQSIEKDVPEKSIVTNNLISEYDAFLKKRKYTGNRTMDESEIDELIEMVNNQYQNYLNNEQNEKQKTRSELIAKLTDGIKIHRNRQKQSVSYLRKIDKMSQSELSEEFNKLYEGKSEGASTETITSNNAYSHLIQDYLKRKQQQNDNNSQLITKELHNEEDTGLTTADTRDLVREYIAKEESFVSKCQEILNLLYVDIDDQKQPTEEVTKVGEPEEVHNNQIISSDNEDNEDSIDELYTGRKQE
jgi:hypothetical protein